MTRWQLTVTMTVTVKAMELQWQNCHCNEPSLTSRRDVSLMMTSHPAVMRVFKFQNYQAALQLISFEPKKAVVRLEVGSPSTTNVRNHHLLPKRNSGMTVLTSTKMSVQTSNSLNI